MARREIMTTIRLKLSEEVVKIIAQHNSFFMVAQAALVGGDKNAPPPKPGDPGVKDLAAGHGSVEDAVAAINQAMRI
jgi:hypothetical protein